MSRHPMSHPKLQAGASFHLHFLCLPPPGLSLPPHAVSDLSGSKLHAYLVYDVISLLPYHSP
jgi:hypothetical protein